MFRACLWQFLWSENGVELARFLRERKVNASIIYITDYPGFALDSFSVSPLEYPLKPVDEWRLAAALDWDRQQKRPVRVWVAVLFPLDEIICLNTSGRKTAIQTSRQIEHAVSLQIERGIPESGLLPKPFQLSG